MKKRQTKKELKKALQQAKPPVVPTVQEAWDIVADFMRTKVSEAGCFFIDNNYKGKGQYAFTLHAVSPHIDYLTSKVVDRYK